MIRKKRVAESKLKKKIAHVDEAEGLAERVAEEIDKLDIEQFRVELPDTEDARCGRACPFQRLLGMAEGWLSLVPQLLPRCGLAHGVPLRRMICSHVI
jgi:hypothetical protein